MVRLNDSQQLWLSQNLSRNNDLWPSDHYSECSRQEFIETATNKWGFRGQDYKGDSEGYAEYCWMWLTCNAERNAVSFRKLICHINALILRATGQQEFEVAGNLKEMIFFYEQALIWLDYDNAHSATYHLLETLNITSEGAGPMDLST